MLMTLVLPGSAQLVAGRRQVGRIALRIWFSLVAAVVVLLLVVNLASTARARRRLEDELAASREELAAVQRRLEALARRVEPRPVADTADTADTAEYVITTAGDPDPEDAATAAAPVPVSGRQFASLAVGESLVTVFSFGHGLRRALSAENRNRIGFEMRRAVRRSRKQRRRAEKEARRHLRTAEQPSMAEDAA
jgi:hypothetical protein